MKKMDFDAIAAASPLNSVAGSVTSKGVHYEPDVKFGCTRHEDVPIPTKPVPKVTKDGGFDLTGIIFGRFIVVGFAAEQNPRKKASWVVRCSCGAYETRKGPAIKNPLNAGDMCRACSHFERAKERYKRLGSAPLETFTKQGAQ